VKNENFSDFSPVKKQSPKLEFAIQWLKDNPDDSYKSGRELEKSVLWQGSTISFATWNDAKRQIVKIISDQS
jgi:hypothetical protein